MRESISEQPKLMPKATEAPKRRTPRFLYIVVGVVVGLLVAGGTAFAATGGVFDNGVQDKATAQQNENTGRLIENQPAPTIKYSVERQNLIKRYKTFSDPNKISYIAELSMDGKVIYTGTVKGKVSSVSSQLTPADRVQCAHADTGDGGLGCSTIQVPEPDGSWSGNGAAIFWYDDRGVYHEWSGWYQQNDAPFTLVTPPVLNIDADAQTK